MSENDHGFDRRTEAERAADAEAVRQFRADRETRQQRAREAVGRAPALEITEQGQQVWDGLRDRLSEGGPPHDRGVLVFAGIWGRLMQAALGDVAPEDVPERIADIAYDCSLDAGAIEHISGNIAKPAAGLLIDTWRHGEAFAAWAYGSDSPWARPES